MVIIAFRARTAFFITLLRRAIQVNGASNLT
jgi:hypothetical protein